ncbi:hypothetical protein NicSoilB4_20880 [Arthrobacter sp. NicSoilB4]|uniref:hypothetical protein n=1 Tax=Arthrobacter sp. NicSoilB4 TaxID=2830997 RepID=UPI001CC7A64E|nr:hypothetical protein [Arthrobacter sp. NicSoilB4]BCW67325.1 hypothetical protein NicSoilB4_20880 [Arthrobacter sp. NicSoilB4]
MVTSSAGPPDNYDAFLSRLDAATTSLSARAGALDKAVAAVSLLLGPYESAVREWERRRRHVGGQLAGHSGPPQSHTALRELHDVAGRMESMLRGRVERVQEQLSVMHGRREAIDKSLLELELSRLKLNSSRMLSQDREKLSSVYSALAGSTVAVSALPDSGLLGDLREAREAVILAEALMELKGY